MLNFYLISTFIYYILIVFLYIVFLYYDITKEINHTKIYSPITWFKMLFISLLPLYRLLVVIGFLMRISKKKEDLEDV